MGRRFAFQPSVETEGEVRGERGCEFVGRKLRQRGLPCED